VTTGISVCRCVYLYVDVTRDAYVKTVTHVVCCRRVKGTAAVLLSYPGCGTLPLVLEYNTAGRRGGAIYFDSCNRLDKTCFVQGLGPRSSSKAILLLHNRAQAGGAIFVECSDIGSMCAEMLGESNSIGALSLLPKIELRGNIASLYGNTLANKAVRLALHHHNDTSVTSVGNFRVVPGQEPLKLVIKLFDSQNSLVIGSGDILEVLICPVTGAADVCTFSSASVPVLNQGFDPLTGLRCVGVRFCGCVYAHVCVRVRVRVRVCVSVT